MHKRQKPSSIQIGITDRCNLKCIHCDIWKSPKRPELSLQEWIEIIARIKEWLGPFRLDIAGGEPFIRQDVVGIIEFCNSHQIQPVVTTNATLLNDETIDILSKIDTLTLNISLDSSSARMHDYLRGMVGTHEKVMEALGKFKARDKKCLITIAVILMGYNYGEIIKIIKHAFQEGLAEGVNFQALDHNFSAPYESDWFARNALWPSADQRDEFCATINEVIALKKSGAVIYNSIVQLEKFKEYFRHPELYSGGPCNVGDANFIIGPAGEVLLCWNKQPVADIRGADLEAVWNSPLAEEVRVAIKDCKRTCRILNCNFS